MPGSPKTFKIAQTVAKETATSATAVEEPSIIVLRGDKFNLKTYLNVDDIGAVETFVQLALDPSGTVTYYFEDLDNGGTPIKIPGGTIRTLSSTDVDIALGGAGAPTNPNVIRNDLKDLGLTNSGLWFLSDPTADITTGTTAASDLVVPAIETAGSWRVLTAVWGANVAGRTSQVGAHDDDLLIQVTT